MVLKEKITKLKYEMFFCIGKYPIIYIEKEVVSTGGIS